MSILSRLGGIAKGLGHSVTEYGDFVIDNMRDMWGETDEDGLAGFLEHLGNVFEASASSSPIVANTPEGRATNRRLELAGAKRRSYDLADGFEQLAGAIPESGRSAIKSLAGTAVAPVKGALDLANRAYEDVVDRPLSYLMAIGSLYDSPEFMESLSGLSWNERRKAVQHEAWRVSEDRSFGDALAFAVLTNDITSQDEVDAAYNDDWFRTVSLAGNLTTSIVADPVGIAFAGVKAFKAGRLAAEANTFRRGYDVAAASRAYEQVSKAKSVAQVRDLMFPSRNALEGPAWSAALFDAAKEGPQAFDLTLRGLMGQAEAITALEASHKQLAYQLGYLTRSRNALQYRWYGKAGEVLGVASDFDKQFFNLLDNAVAETNSQAVRLERTLAVQNTLDTIPRVSRTSAFRGAATRSEFYRSSPLAAPLRVVFGMNPQTTLSTHADDLDVQVNRFLEKAGVEPDVRDAVRSEAIEANRRGPAAARAAVNSAETAVIERLAAKYDIDPELILQARKDGLTATNEALSSARYDANTGNTVVKFMDDEGNLVERYLPLAPEQLQSYVFLPDVGELEKAAKLAAGVIKKGEIVPLEVADGLLSMFNRAWKPAVLLSVRWPMRVVGEENVRALSKIGAMGVARAHVATATGYVADKLGRTADDLAAIPYVARKPVEIGGQVFAPSLMERGGQAIEARLLEETAQFNRLYGQAEVGLRSDLYKTVEQWTELKPGDHRYYEAWEHAVNNQIGRSRLARHLIEHDLDLDEGVRWLTHDPEGVRFAQTMPIRSRNPEGWVNAVADQIIRYLPEKELQEAALRNEFTAARAKELIPDTNLHPFVHGQNLEEVLGTNGLANFAEKAGRAVDDLMAKLSTNPTIRLSRQPVFDALYRNRLTTLVERAADEGLEMTAVRRAQMEKAARRYALGETRELLYDMAEQSRLADAFRFVAPFADASREVITRWAGITLDNPLFVRRMQELWQAPEQAGFVYDGLGRRVGPDGKVEDLNGRRVEPEGGKFVRFIAPEWATDIPVLGEVLRGGIQFNKESLNTILANPFGPGPLVQVAFSKLYNPTPEDKEKWKWLFPYGVADGFWETVLPSTVKEATKGEDARSRVALTKHIWNDLAVQWELDGRPGGEAGKPTIAEAKDIEERIWQMMAVPSRFLSPVGVQTISPYQPYIDYLRQLQDADPATAGQVFYDKFGPEFASLANSLTQSNDHVPPTVAAYRQRNKYANLIEAHPELGGLIVDDVGGDFSDAVYEEQLKRAIGPNTDEKQREKVPYQDFVKRPYISAGWNEFTKAMDALDAVRIQRGLPSLKVKGAQDLAAAKQEIVRRIASRYPDWYDEYRVSDPAKEARRIEGLRAIAKDPSLQRREDIRLLGVWVQARDVFNAELRRRNAAGDSGDINAVSNVDLAEKWGVVVGALTESNLMFSKLFYRYLDNADPSGMKGAA